MPSAEVVALGEKIAALELEVTEAKTVKAGATLLLNQLGQIVRDNIDNKPLLLAFADSITNRTGEIDMSSNELAEAIAANTPAA